MIPQSTDAYAHAAAPPRRNRSTMVLDGGFLLLTGAAMLTLELVAHHLGGGPLAAVFAGSPYTIGWVEAHGLAALTGLVFMVVGAQDGRRFWHVWAIAVHGLLGGANVLFWSSFVTFGTTPVGLGATVVHAVLTIAQAWCLVSARTEGRR